MPHVVGGDGIFAGVRLPNVARELTDKIRDAKTVILHRRGRWTPIEKVKECGTLLSECLPAIPI